MPAVRQQSCSSHARQQEAKTGPSENGGAASLQRENIPPIEERMKRLLIDAAQLRRPCKRCGVTLYFVRHSTGNLVPYTEEGINHFLNCPQASEFRQGGHESKQAAMFDTAPLPE